MLFRNLLPLLALTIPPGTQSLLLSQASRSEGWPARVEVYPEVPRTQDEMDEEQWGRRHLGVCAAAPGGVISLSTLSASRKSLTLYQRGLNRLARRDLVGAAKAFEDSGKASPQFALAWHALGVLRRVQGRRPEAREAYLRAVRADPRYWKPYAQLVDMAAEEHNWPEVLAVSGRAVHIVSTPDAGLYVYNAIANLAERRWDAAVEAARQAIRMDPEQRWPKAYQVLGLAQYRLGQLEEAEASLHCFLDLVEGVDPEEERIARLQLAELRDEHETAQRSPLVQSAAPRQ